MNVEIDLLQCESKNEVLLKFGEALRFGGKNGNNSVTGPFAGKGGGINWDALNDSLRYLDSGCICGTSPKLTFPIIVKITNYQRFNQNVPEQFKVLVEILEDAKAEYTKEGKVFEFK